MGLEPPHICELSPAHGRLHSARATGAWGLMSPHRHSSPFHRAAYGKYLPPRNLTPILDPFSPSKQVLLHFSTVIALSSGFALFTNPVPRIHFHSLDLVGFSNQNCPVLSSSSKQSPLRTSKYIMFGSHISCKIAVVASISILPNSSHLQSLCSGLHQLGPLNLGALSSYGHFPQEDL